ncbi:polysaccharide deacetylase family protein [Patescibacteria group bacterium]
MVQQKKLICITLDIEKDYGYFDTYYALNNIDILLKLIKKYNIKITVFLVGYLIKERKDIIEKFKSVPVEFALHSYYHDIKNKDSVFKRQEVIKAKEVYLDFFKKQPLGYRAPQGAITRAEIMELIRLGFKYDCSLFPYWRPGLYNNLNIPTRPFFLSSELMEIPLSVLPVIRFPISLSYIQFFGWKFYKFFLKFFGWPSLIVFDMHLHNLKKVRSLRGAPWFSRIFYIRNQNNGFKILEEFIKLTKSKGYKSIFVSELNV